MNTLTQLFDWLLAASFRASLLVIAVLFIQAALHRHLGARMRYALWLPVLIVLLMPVLPQSRWSIQQVFQTPPPPAKIIPAPIAPAMVPSPVVFEAAAAMPEPINWQRVFLMTWISVSAAMLILGSISFMLTLRRFNKARHSPSDELLATLSQIAREMHLRRIPQVLISSSISGPAVTGLLHPTLLLPAQFDREFTPAEARLVLKHELMHLKRGDLPLNAFMCVLMALHWFNPLLWIAFFKIRADRESACDAQVLHDATSGHRVEYGHALLKVETAFCPRGFSLGFAGIFQRGFALRYRIQSIATHRAPHPAMQVLTTLCIVLLTFFGVTRAESPAKPTSYVQAKLDQIILPQLQFRDATVEECIEFLRVKGRVHDTATDDPTKRGVSILLRPSVPPVKTSITLDLENVPLGEALRHVAELAKLKMSIRSYAVIIEPSIPGGEEDSQKPKLAVEIPAGKIILPGVEFLDAKLADCLDFIRLKARELDPGKKGVNIILKPGGDETARITLTLKNVPVHEALRYCAELSKRKLANDGQAFILTPSTNTK